MPTILAYHSGIVKWVGTAYCHPMDANGLKTLAAVNKQDKERERASYARLVAAIWEASDQGMRQVDIVGAVGLTRERVRQICDPVYRATHPAG